MVRTLFTTRRFLPLFITQFLGAFNDNMLKNGLVILITYQLANSTSYSPQILVTIAAGLFILPFFIFSAFAGQLADKYDRAFITRIIKIFEIIIMLFASVGFAFEHEEFLIFILFASGIHSAFFGPIKYALLPQQLKSTELLAGNAYIEAGTFLAILLGTIYGGLLITREYGPYLVSIALLTVAILGFIASCYIPKSPGQMPHLKVNYNIISETFTIIRYAKNNSRMITTILCISWFWFVGAIFLAQLPSFVKNDLHTEAKVVTLMLTIFSVGIACGSIFCKILLRGAIKSTYVPVAAVGMTIFIIDLYITSQNKIYFNLPALLQSQQFLHMYTSWHILIDLFFIAVCGGIYIVPLYAILQSIADQKYMARVIAATNIFNALFMVLSTIYTLGMLTIHRTIPEVFLGVALLNIAVLIIMYKKLPRRNNIDLSA